MPDPVLPVIPELKEPVPEKRRVFFVYILESPSAVDLYQMRYEGEVLSRMLKLAHLPSVHRLIVNEEALRAALNVGLNEVLETFPDYAPAIHLSAHGDERGIQLSDGEIVAWPALREILMPVNRALDGNLLLCISACKGLAAHSMAMQEGALPFFAVVGSSGEPKWSDTAIAYATFYYLVAKGKSIQDAVAAMNTASGEMSFGVVRGRDSQRLFLDELEQRKKAFRAFLKEALAKREAESLARALELK